MLNFNSIGRVAVLFAWAAAFRSAAIRTAFCDAGNTIRAVTSDCGGSSRATSP
jgi:hypothetical protein